MYEKSVNSDEFLWVFSGPWNLSHANFFYICMHSWLSFLSVGEKKLISYFTVQIGLRAIVSIHVALARRQPERERKNSMVGSEEEGKKIINGFFSLLTKTLICCTKSISMANTARARAPRRNSLKFELISSLSLSPSLSSSALLLT